MNTITTSTDFSNNEHFIQWHDENLAMVIYNMKKRGIFGPLKDEVVTVNKPHVQYTMTIVSNTITLNYADGTVKTYTDPTPDQPLPDSDDYSQFE